MIVYDLNQVIKDGGDWATLNGGTVPEILPLYGYDDTEPPFIVYSWVHANVSAEKYYQRRSIARFYVYDNNIDRMNSIAEEITNLLNVGDDLANIRTLVPTGTSYRILYCYLMSGNPGPPLEREGFSFTSVDFDVGYISTLATLTSSISVDAVLL